MRLDQIIEGVNDNYLYHSTTKRNAMRIVLDNSIKAATGHVETIRLNFNSLGIRPSEINGKNFANKQRIIGVSLTRSINFAKNWMPYGVVFALDKQSLKNNHRLIPITYYRRHQEPEEEEFVIGPVKNLSKHLVAIYITKDAFETLQIELSNSVNDIVIDSDNYSLSKHDYITFLNHPKLVIQDKNWKSQK